MDTGLTRQVAATPPHWASQRIKTWDQNAFLTQQAFISEKYWSSQHSINVFEVVGTDHPDYQGLTWLEFLQQGRRMALNLRLQEENPGYYLDEALKQPSIYYIEMDDSGWHVGGDGNHRTCIARFMFQELGRTMLHGVHVLSYRTDPRARAIYQGLQQLIRDHRLHIQVEPIRLNSQREDTAGWMRERYTLGLRVQDLARGTDERLTIDQAACSLETLRHKTQGWKGWLWRALRGGR